MSAEHEIQEDIKIAFDAEADSYDLNFTQTTTGRMQREKVHRYYQHSIPENSTVLEFGCGTGEDAIFLANRDVRVTATDPSPEMIRIAKGKAKDRFENLSFECASMQEIMRNQVASQFDFVVSNFGAMNCLSPDELKAIFTSLPAALSNGGECIFVLMPQACAWESFYFLLTFKWSKAFRRNSDKPVDASVSGSRMPVFYYSPNRIRRMLPKGLKVTKVKPVGFFIPPSYLDRNLSRIPGFLRFLNFLENSIGSFSFLSNLADHYLISIRLNSPSSETEKA